jgi:3-oxoacyl-[acyl-carrier protein] reductase
VALVTGANHGIGAATAIALADQGAAVLIHFLRLPLTLEEQVAADAQRVSAPGELLYRSRQAQAADDVLQAIRERGGRAEACEADLADPAQIPRLFDQAERALGPVDVLVNNAAVGGAPTDTFAPLEPDAHDWLDRAMHTINAQSHDRHFAVNSRATALMMAQFAQRHVRRGAQWGRIINVSTDGAACFPREVSYGASKAALESYSRSAARELAPFGITVNIVSPGPIQTDWITPEAEEQIRATIPLGRIGRSEDVADVIVFLSSEQARWLTGQLIYVGGGHTM